jgi:hypothetical protein
LSGVEQAATTFSAAHFIYIPACIFLGVIIGWLLGSRSARAEIVRLRELLDTEETRQAAERMKPR